MKKNYSIVCLVQAFIIIASAILFPVTVRSQELTAEQKQEKCQNNTNRIAELGTELWAINADLSQTMEKKEIQDAKDKIDFLMSMKNNLEKGEYSDGEIWKKTFRIATQYNYKG